MKIVFSLALFLLVGNGALAAEPITVTHKGKTYRVGAITTSPNLLVTRVLLTDVASNKRIYLYHDGRYGRAWHTNELSWLVGSRGTARTGVATQFNDHNVCGRPGEAKKEPVLVGSQRWARMKKPLTQNTLRELRWLMQSSESHPTLYAPLSGR